VGQTKNPLKFGKRQLENSWRHLKEIKCISNLYPSLLIVIM